MSREVVHITVVTVYMLALLGVGVAKVRRVRTHADFTLAGRGLSTFVLFGTLLATWIGTGSIFGNSEKTVEIGIAAWFLPIGGVLGILALVPLAPRARRFAGFTVQDILEARYSPAARVLGTFTLVLAYVTIVSYQYRAGGAVLHLLAPGISLGQATILAALFVVAYTALAGMISVAYTDVVNGLLMMVGFAVAVPLLWGRVGGWEGMAATMPADHMKWFGVLGPREAIALTLPAFLLVLGDANMYQRFFSARSSGEPPPAPSAGSPSGVLADGGRHHRVRVDRVGASTVTARQSGARARRRRAGRTCQLCSARSCSRRSSRSSCPPRTRSSSSRRPASCATCYQRFLNHGRFVNRQLVLVSRLVVVVLGWGSPPTR